MILIYIFAMIGQDIRSRHSGHLTGVLLTGILLLAGCSSALQPPVTQGGPEERCLALFQSVEDSIRKAGVKDGGEHQPDGHPFLRFTRFDTSLGRVIDSESNFSIWAGRLTELDRKARAIELNNLPAAEREALGDDVERDLDACRKMLMERELTLPERRKALLASAEVPDDYLTGYRAAGLYPISALFVSAGVNRWHEEERNTYATPLEHLPVAGKLARWSSSNAQPL